MMVYMATSNFAQQLRQKATAVLDADVSKYVDKIKAECEAMTSRGLFSHSVSTDGMKSKIGVINTLKECGLKVEEIPTKDQRGETMGSRLVINW